MDLPHCMEAICNIFFRRAVATSLLRHDMDQDGLAQGSCTIEDLFHGGNIVAVNRSEVLQSQVPQSSSESVYPTTAPFRNYAKNEEDQDGELRHQ